MSEFIAGLDLGQQGDYTALAILERVTVTRSAPRIERIEYPPEIPRWLLRRELHGGDGDQSEYAAVHGAAQALRLPTVVEERTVQDTAEELHLRHLERPALGTPYPAIVTLVCERLAAPMLATQTSALVIDATGVGRPVVDLLRDDRRLRAPLTPVTITGGDGVTRDGSEYHVPKRDLVSALQVALQTGALKIAQGLPLADTLIAELMNFQAKISLRGHDSYEAGPAGAWREGAHDDLVLAVALACWYAQRPQPDFSLLDCEFGW